MARATKQTDQAFDSPDIFHIKVHGGLGDIIWVAKKLQSKKIFLHISQENRSRPRRSGILADHLPNVVGWAWDETAFCPDTGEDWPDPGDPCCAIGKKFSELEFRPGIPLRLECNRWLEGGRRIEDWLPDLPTEHHFEFEPCASPSIEIQKPCVVLHLAGWPDVPDRIWLSAIDLFRNVGHVYIVGGSYDFRPRRIYQQGNRGLPGTTLIEDTTWANIQGLLKSCTYCFGHASGFTAIADVLRVPGAVFNPRVVPRLVGTWNSLENRDQLHVDRLEDFESAFVAAHDAMKTGDRATWPVSVRQGPRLVVERQSIATPAVGAARTAAAAASYCRNVLVWTTDDAFDNGVAAAILDGAYVAGKIVRRMTLIGCSAAMLAGAMRESQRSTARPAITSYQEWENPVDSETYGLAVLYLTRPLPTSASQVRTAWSVLSASGTILVGGRSAAAAIESLASALRAKVAEVERAPGWFYLHRRL